MHKPGPDFGNMSDLRQFFMHDTHVHGSVFIWRRRDMLCTSGSMDDVTFE